MAEEEVTVATTTSPVTSDQTNNSNKRKLEDLEPKEEEEEKETVVNEAPPPQADEVNLDDKSDHVDDVAAVDSPDSKRLKVNNDVNESNDGLASENGHDKVEENADVVEKGGEGKEGSGKSEEGADDDVKSTEEKAEELNVDNQEETKAAVADEKNGVPEVAAGEEEEEEPESDDAQTTSRTIEVPNDKVGVLIGKGGETIKYLQYNSGAKIQITRDMDADPRAKTRPVELIGTLHSIKKAEKLINAVIAEADAGGSPSLVARGIPRAQTALVGEQLEMQVPNEKVGLIIGRGGDTIKALQAKSGARIQLIPQHLPDGDGSKERTVRVTGDRKQIEIAQEMIKEAMSQTVRPLPHSGSYNQQQSYRGRGSNSSSHWGPRGSYSSQPPYDYHHRGPYPSQSSEYQPPSYGGYPPHHMGPRGNFNSGWEQRPPNMQGPVLHGGGYDYYGGQGGHASDHPSSAPMSGHGPGPSPTPGMGHPPQSNYNHGQTHGPDYGHHAPYPQPQQGYGHGYDEPKYDNHAQAQHPYGHGASQPVYQQPSNQPGYGAQQQYGKQPSYGMPSQGPPQSYGPPRPGQPGDVPYQAPVQSSQSYASNMPPQQQYPYASSGPMQQSYPPYGTASTTDGYNQAVPASGPGYPPQGGQSVPAYGQAAGQQATGYAQGPSGGYGAYPSSQGYTEQQPAQNAAGYGYQGSQDPAYATGSAAAVPTYTAPASGQQGYAQPTATPTAAAPTQQQSYDQSVPQSGAYPTAPATAQAGYGKTVSPQPAYPQYDATQMYAAPR